MPDDSEQETRGSNAQNKIARNALSFMHFESADSERGTRFHHPMARLRFPRHCHSATTILSASHNCSIISVSMPAQAVSS